MAEAAVRLWRLPQERPDEPDSAHADVWTALVEAGAVEQAAGLAVAAIRDRQRLRPAAFVDLTEHIGGKDPERLLDLARVVLETDWEANPYLAAIFARLLEGKQQLALWTFIKKHRDALRAPTDRWVLVGFVLTTSSIGDRYDLAEWFAGWDQRPDVPMWLLGAYAATVMQQAQTMAKLPRPAQNNLFALAERARSRAVADETEPYFVVLSLLDALRARKEDEFFAAFSEYRERIAKSVASSPLDHPLVRYTNSVKRSFPINAEDFSWERSGPDAGLIVLLPVVALAQVAAQSAQKRPFNFRNVELVADLRSIVRAADRIFPLLVELSELPWGDKRAAEVTRTIEKARPTTFPWIIPTWKRLVRQRVPFWTRVRLYFV